MSATIDEMSINSAAVLTVSDTAAINNGLDSSGPQVRKLLQEAGFVVKESAIVADNEADIVVKVKTWADEQSIALICITGGTGLSPRDITPETIRPLLTRETPGLTHLLLSKSIAITPMAALSRPVTGLRNATLVITLPGSTKACTENMIALQPILHHALEIIHSRPTKHSHHRPHVCVHEHEHERKESQHSVISDPLDTPTSQRSRQSPFELKTVEEARAIIQKYATTLGPLRVDVDEQIVGYVLAETVRAVENVPASRTSIVDGYAVRDCDSCKGLYKVAATISLAGGNETTSKTTPLTSDVVVRVATGGIVPEAAVAVVMVEDTECIRTRGSNEEHEVIINTSVNINDNIREIGSDCRIGDIVGRHGQFLSGVGGEIGTLVAAGIRQIPVFRKPRVGVFSTGNEVRPHLSTANLLQGEVRDANRPMLLAALRDANCCKEVRDLGIIKDDATLLEERLRESLKDLDVVITTGGVSMGEADFMKPVLEHKLGATIHFGRVRMKPGKPTTFATVPFSGEQRLVFALPGNPVSAIVTFHLFVLPALRQMGGFPSLDNRVVSVQTGHTFYLDARPEFQRVQVSVRGGRLVAESTDRFQQSSRIMNTVDANGLLELPMKTSTMTKIESGVLLPCIMIQQIISHVT